jgi:hypothetical protein
MRSQDTTPEADAMQRAILARLSGAQRVELAWAMSETVRGIMADGLRARHPSTPSQT